MKDDTKIEQELAWIGDAVLGLFARNWILEKEKKNGCGNVYKDDI